jgi:hypothetical protein
MLKQIDPCISTIANCSSSLLLVCAMAQQAWLTISSREQVMNVFVEKEWCSESLGVSLDMQHHQRETAFLFEKHLDWTVWQSGRSWNLRFKKGFYERFALRFIEQ